MKKQSLKLLQEIVSACKESGVYCKVEEKFRQIVNIEELARVANKRFNLADIVKLNGNTGYAYGMDGIFHDHGFEVATDGHILATQNAQYDESLEGRAINVKTGKETAVPFPKYKAVLDEAAAANTKPYTFDFDALDTMKRAVKTDSLLGNEQPFYFCKIGDSVFRMERVILMAMFLKAHNQTRVLLKPGSDQSTAYAKAGDGSECLIEPCLNTDFGDATIRPTIIAA